MIIKHENGDSIDDHAFKENDQIHYYCTGDYFSEFKDYHQYRLYYSVKFYRI